MKTTSLHEEHLRRGARMTEFAGWRMPLLYSGIVDEHRAVRGVAGLFDISHMGQVRVSGAGSTAWLDTVVTNRLGKTEPGVCQYTLLLNEGGGVIDDLIVYRLDADASLLIVNAANTAADLAWLDARRPPGVELVHLGESRAGFALQGPAAAALFASLFGTPMPGRFRHKTIRFDGCEVLVAGTGYTGERGCELFLAGEIAVGLWNTLLEAGAGAGLKPCGLGARDSLRLEMGYPLGGHELLPTRTPLEAGLDAFVDLDKPAFTGRDALLAQRACGLAERLAAFVMPGQGPPPRAGYAVVKGGRRLGTVTSGGLSPTLDIRIGLAYVAADAAREGETIEVVIRDRTHPATVVALPFHRPEKG